MPAHPRQPGGRARRDPRSDDRGRPRASPASTGSARISTWIYRVATNAALDELRRRTRRPLPAEVQITSDPRGDGTGAVDARLDIDAALASIPDDFRVAVVLRDLCDLDYGEIAEALNVPIGTVRSRIARGRAALEAQLREPDADPERLSETT